MDAEENILKDNKQTPTRNKLYPSFVPCQYCGFDLWTLLNYNLVKKAIKDRNKFGNKYNVVDGKCDTPVKKKKKIVSMVCNTIPEEDETSSCCMSDSDME